MEMYIVTNITSTAEDQTASRPAFDLDDRVAAAQRAVRVLEDALADFECALEMLDDDEDVLECVREEYVRELAGELLAAAEWVRSEFLGRAEDLATLAEDAD